MNFEWPIHSFIVNIDKSHAIIKTHVSSYIFPLKTDVNVNHVAIAKFCSQLLHYKWSYKQKLQLVTVKAASQCTWHTQHLESMEKGS